VTEAHAALKKEMHRHEDIAEKCKIELTEMLQGIEEHEAGNTRFVSFSFIIGILTNYKILDKIRRRFYRRKVSRKWRSLYRAQIRS
jgi:hypothetical protein